MSEKTPAFTFKILLLGDGAVGKTSLVRRFCHDTFSQNYLMTIGMEPSQRYVTLDGRYLCLSLWDIAGQKSFKRLREMFYRGAKGSLVTFDLTRRDTFDGVANWVEEAKKKSKDQIFILVGNKNDLVDQRKVTMNEAKEKAKDLGFTDYIETSAKTGELVPEAFNTMGKIILKSVTK